MLISSPHNLNLCSDSQNYSAMPRVFKHDKTLLLVFLNVTWSARLLFINRTSNTQFFHDWFIWIRIYNEWPFYLCHTTVYLNPCYADSNHYRAALTSVSPVSEILLYFTMPGSEKSFLKKVNMMMKVSSCSLVARVAGQHKLSEGHGFNKCLEQEESRFY